jgi:aspartyl-tRNA(Asn)/glutamyl-tRNA(Gln) amidotransferase subunit B
LAQNGFLDIDINSQQDSPKLKRIRIRRIHLEEDVGKLIHKRESSYIDYNRAGIPLLEIVTEPDISSPDEAYLFLVELKTILQYLDVSNCDMEKGELRVDTNVSLKGFKKVEIKNLNSFKAVKEALYYEIERQKKLKKSYQETRLWDSNKKITISMRKKEEAFDYRYFPEPDLPIFKIRDSMIKKVKLSFPELPFEKRKRFQKEYGLDERTIRILVQEKELADYFEKIVSEFKNWIGDKDFPEERMFSIIKTFSNYLISDLKGLMAEAKIGFDKLKITPENFSELIFLIDKGEISSRSAKDVLKTMFETGADPSSIIEEKGLKKISDFEEIEKVVKETISENQKAVEDYKKGKETALEFLLGKVMMKTKGKLDPQKTREAIKKLLS